MGANDGNAIVEIVVTVEQIVAANTMFRQNTAFMVMSNDYSYKILDRGSLDDDISLITSDDDKASIRAYFAAGGARLTVINVLKMEVVVPKPTGSYGQLVLSQNGTGTYTNGGAPITFNWSVNSANTQISFSNSSNTNVIANVTSPMTLTWDESANLVKLTIEKFFSIKTISPALPGIYGNLTLNEDGSGSYSDGTDSAGFSWEANSDDTVLTIIDSTDTNVIDDRDYDINLSFNSSTGLITLAIAALSSFSESREPSSSEILYDFLPIEAE
ncbi:MAG: hypothetical protein FWE37_05130, partial [Spirochaetaceae bacterium]|nr:hypothetical protein [Spirochaetaceae bacterium]